MPAMNTGKKTQKYSDEFKVKAVQWSHQQRKLYSDHMHSSACRVLGAVFARLPTVEETRVSSYRQVIVTAILDRLLHHSTTLNIKGESYRLKDKLRAGLVTTPTPEGGRDIT